MTPSRRGVFVRLSRYIGGSDSANKDSNAQEKSTSASHCLVLKADQKKGDCGCDRQLHDKAKLYIHTVQMQVYRLFEKGLRLPRERVFGLGAVQGELILKTRPIWPRQAVWIAQLMRADQSYLGFRAQTGGICPIR